MKPGFENRVKTMLDSIRPRVDKKPKLGIVLGSGLSGLADNEEGTAVSYSEIAEFPVPTVEGHRGVMIVTEYCIYLAGRFHYYEGYPMDDVVLPIMLLSGLGVETLILTNAAGGINREYTPGDLVLIRDHINLMGTHPLIGPNSQEMGPRFPDMTRVYSRELRGVAMEVSKVPLSEGVYAALSGPSYETPAEIQMLNTLGADMVGMSTVPEAIVANYLGMNILGISCITNMAAGILDQPLDHTEVIETGKKVEARFKGLVSRIIKALAG